MLRNFERLPDSVETATKAHAALMAVLSAFDNSVILVSNLNPVMIPSIESSDRWRTLLRSFVLIDLHSTPRQRIGEDEADYQQRISSVSYFHWLFDGLPKPEKLVMIQLAQESVVNPNGSHTVYGLMEQGLIERRRGLLTITDVGFAKFLPDALPRQTIKLWEKELAGTQTFSLQTSLMILGVGVIGFLVYTQGDVFNTWVTYASGAAAAVPKVFQFFDNLWGKTTAKASLGFAILRLPGFHLGEKDGYLINKIGFAPTGPHSQSLPSNISPTQKFLWRDSTTTEADREEIQVHGHARARYWSGWTSTFMMKPRPSPLKHRFPPSIATRSRQSSTAT